MNGINQIQLLINQGKRIEAWRLLNQLLTANPENEKAWLMAYELAQDSKKSALLEKAKKYLPADSAIFNQSSLPQSWLNLDEDEKPFSEIKQSKQNTLKWPRFVFLVLGICIIFGSLFAWENSMLENEDGIRKLSYSIGTDSINGVFVLLVGISILIIILTVSNNTAYLLISSLGLIAWLLILAWRFSGDLSSLGSVEGIGEDIAEAFRLSIAREEGLPFTYYYSEFAYGYLISIWASFLTFLFGVFSKD